MFRLIDQEDDGHPDGPPAKRLLSRRRYGHGRHNQVKFRTNDEEYRQLQEAGELASLTPSGFAADASMRAAEATLRAAGKGSGVADADRIVPDHAALRQAVVSLMEATNEVRRVGHNLNQAVAKFHASGEPPEWLKDAADKADAKLKWLSSEAYELARVVGRAK